MSKTKSIVFHLKFVDLLNKPFPNLYHEIREAGRLISSARSDSDGLGTPISRPPGTILVVHIRHPLTKEMIKVKSYISVPAKEGKYTLKAPFYIQLAKLKALSEISGSYKRSTHKVVAGKDEYEVKKGQDLYTIAKMHDTTWQILAQLNKSTIKDPDKIVPGQFIKVPPTGSRLTGKTNERPDSLTSQTHYKVKKGETLSSISQRSGVSVEQLQRMNGITNPTTLQAGQTIKLRSDGSAQTHTTPKPSPTPTARPTPKQSSKPSSSDEDEGFFGGLLESIEDGLGALGDKAKEGIEGINDAMSGDKHDKPSGQAPATSTDSNSNSSNSSTSGNYTIKSGDTLSGIAQKHGVNTNDLARANGLKLTDTIHPGNKLKIPKGGSSSSNTGNSSQSSKADSPVNVTTKPSNSSDGTPKDVATTNGACICKAHDLIWGKNFNCDERLKVIEICQNLWPNNYLKTANNLMAVFAWESGEKFETGAPNQRNSGGTGLIQIIPSTYKDLTGEEPILETIENYWGHGKTLNRIKQLANMTVIQYLDVVEKYFQPIKNKDLEFIDFYLQVLFPISSGLPEHVVFASSLSKLDLPNEKQSRKMARVAGYPNNRMDPNGDEMVMKSEIAQSVEHYIKDGKKYRSFGACEKFSVVEKPVSSSSDCPSNILGCFCNRTKKLPMRSGFLTHSRIIKHHTPKLERRNYTNKIKKIILHRTVNSSAQSTFNSFNSGSKPYGTHFVVDKDGKIYQTANLNKLTIHAGNANPYSVGIEVVGMPLARDGKTTMGTKDRPVVRWEKLTTDQTQSVACLTRYLLIHYGLDQSNIAVHEDVAAKTEGEGRTVYNAIKDYL
ncbi:LysM peptidoglycan-binding domain-containing protein [Psychrobacter sp. GW64-MNA-CIBAN-0177]|uniref:LysM peptidoglycan-binding domain-containing protein n=2 Tax=unclassified Psychrobacter TaxID=196806 RepID=UPI0033173EC9